MILLGIYAPWLGAVWASRRMWQVFRLYGSRSRPTRTTRYTLSTRDPEPVSDGDVIVTWISKHAWWVEQCVPSDIIDITRIIRNQIGWMFLVAYCDNLNLTVNLQGYSLDTGGYLLFIMFYNFQYASVWTLMWTTSIENMCASIIIIFGLSYFVVWCNFCVLHTPQFTSKLEKMHYWIILTTRSRNESNRIHPVAGLNDQIA